MINPANFPTSAASCTMQTAWQEPAGRDPQAFIPLLSAWFLPRQDQPETAPSTARSSGSSAARSVPTALSAL